ncbi:hypothetical protein K3N28_20880 [Glycomyces sp. TRM65418]|uniref:hypothetical protein n=1 Tax=Glycomyces sp. TRM65418 TaxID=2867006 RepID=UPI001CE4E34D|nr:hypothetical protein [Glycomyces sp. TRM65418]MCC3765520.1 hypothetical protein [Glycomyces sp. TRM65418]QZD55127.1 hypothetical protein K3N28_20775 [Glycomyces sp. TRM65418]
MWSDLLDRIGAATESIIAPIAEVIGPEAVSWGWAVLLLGAGWRVLTWPWLVRGAERRIERQRDPAAPKPPRGWFERVGTVFTVAQILVVVTIALWSRTGPAADEAAFYGLRTLSSSPATQGPGGLAWAAALTLAGTVVGLLALRASGVDDPRQRFFARYMAPVIFAGLGLFLPAAMVVPFTTTMAMNVAAVQWAAARLPRVREEVPA